MHCEIVKHIPYNQGNNISDILVGGRCFAYAALYFNYISSYIYCDQPVDYAALKIFLNRVDLKTKKFLQTLEGDKYNKNIAILNDNLHEGETYKQNFKKICVEILEHLEVLKEQKSPAAYFIRFTDYDQTIMGQPLKHIICLYLASPTEIHLFDSNTGTHILRLPSNYQPEELEQDIFEFVFKRSLYIFTPYTDTFEFEVIRSFYASDYAHDVKKQLIFDCIQTLSQDPMQNTDFLKEMDFDELTLQFIERHALALRVQQGVAIKNRHTTTTCFEQFSHFKNGITQSVSNFFGRNNYQVVSNDNVIEEKTVVHSAKK